jgi:hypothetical protein
MAFMGIPGNQRRNADRSVHAGFEGRLQSDSKALGRPAGPIVMAVQEGGHLRGSGVEDLPQ